MNNTLVDQLVRMKNRSLSYVQVSDSSSNGGGGIKLKIVLADSLDRVEGYHLFILQIVPDLHSHILSYLVVSEL